MLTRRFERGGSSASQGYDKGFLRKELSRRRPLRVESPWSSAYGNRRKTTDPYFRTR
jgi:hypothetical protein